VTDRSRGVKRGLRASTLGLACLLGLQASAVQATESSVGASNELSSERVDALWERLEAQERRLNMQQEVIATQQARLDAQDSLLATQAERLRAQGALLDEQATRLSSLRGGPGDRELLLGEWETQEAAALQARTGRGAAAGRVYGQVAQGEARVGQAPSPEDPPEVPILADQGGVLTPPGVLTIEPEFEFTSASTLQFEFSGIGVQDALLIGDLEASASDREVFTSRFQARLGLRERLEASLEVPYLWRSDRFERRITTESEPQGLSDRSDGSGLGDVAVGLHYQFPRAADSRSTFVGNLRVKADTGRSPFDVDLGPGGIADELPTGSGYWSIEPSLTWIHPSDPAVLFGTLSYSWNIPTDVDEDRLLDGQTVRIGRVDPGDAIGAGFGIGLSLNETTSLSLSYSHTYVLRTESEINETDFVSRPIHVGELQMGLAFMVSNAPIRLTAAIGVTENAPDVRISLGVPVSWSLFE